MYFGGKEYEGRFKLTTGRALTTMTLWTVIWYACFAATTAMFLVRYGSPGEFGQFEVVLSFSHKVGLYSAAVGLVFSVIAMLWSLGRRDMEISHSRAAMPVGQATVNCRMFICGLVAGTVIATWLIGSIVPASIELRPSAWRGFIGAFQGIMSASVSCGLMFRKCRL